MEIIPRLTQVWCCYRASLFIVELVPVNYQKSPPGLRADGLRDGEAAD